jgi:hypothetical protein
MRPLPMPNVVQFCCKTSTHQSTEHQAIAHLWNYLSNYQSLHDQEGSH